MNTGRLAVIGLLFIGAALAQDDANTFNNNFFDPDSANEEAPFWWMSKGSPFKRSYDVARVQPAQQRFDFANNPFLSGRPFAAADSEPAAAENSFARASSFRGPGYLPPDNEITTVPCNGNGRVCVPRYQCVGGQIDANQVPNGPRSQVSLLQFCLKKNIIEITKNRARILSRLHNSGYKLRAILFSKR